MSKTQTQLEHRVRAVLRTEHACGDPLFEEPASIVAGDLTEREQDLLDWGTTFGLAFGLARMDDPCESLESVGQRALLAARRAYEGYGDAPARLGAGIEAVPA